MGRTRFTFKADNFMDDNERGVNKMIEFEETGDNRKLSYIAKEKDINLTYPESQHMFRRLVERGRSGIFMADVKGCLFYVNHAFVTMLGYENKDDILGGNLADLLFRSQEKRTAFLRKLNETGSVYDYELPIVRKDGVDVILSITANFIEGDTGNIIGVDGIVHEVTDKNQLEQELLTEKQKLEQILGFDEAINSIKEFDELAEFVVERSMKILEARKCSLMLVDEQRKFLTIAGARGLSEDVVKAAKIELGEPIAGVVAGEGQPLLVKNIEYDRRFYRANRPSYLGRSFMVVPIRLGNKCAGVINVSDKVVKKNLSKGSRLNYEESFNEMDLRIFCVIAREVSIAFENVRLYSELNSLVVTDPLTHIFNYRQFSKSLDYEIKRARRSETPLCLIMIDLDDFKSYNDTFGHLQGDDLLINLGRIAKEQLREVDIVCRYAGDEFAVILPDTDITGAQYAAKKIQETVGQFAFKRAVTLSCGIAKYVQGWSQYEFILNADKALYRAKQEGKNRVCVS
jgi:diguanylate cyclase (GGDEF)-like protein/PAS domain S-box-containing protein